MVDDGLESKLVPLRQDLVSQLVARAVAFLPIQSTEAHHAGLDRQYMGIVR